MQGNDRMSRSSSFHRPKRQLMGHHQVPPAWRPNVVQANKLAAEQPGSKIFLSRLPTDVNEQEVEELFKKTIGPVKEAFLVYNSQGNSKGMAVVSFVRPADAVQARAKYNGKIVDGRRPIKIEIIADGVPTVASGTTTPTGPAAAPAALSLLDRLGFKGVPAAPGARVPPLGPRAQQVSLVQRTQQQGPAANQPLVAKLQAQAAAAMAGGRPVHTPIQLPPRAPMRAVPVGPSQRARVKKGPKRLKKRDVTAEDLDKDMDDYRSSFPENDFSMS